MGPGHPPPPDHSVVQRFCSGDSRPENARSIVCARPEQTRCILMGCRAHPHPPPPRLGFRYVGHAGGTTGKAKKEERGRLPLPSPSFVSPLLDICPQISRDCGMSSSLSDFRETFNILLSRQSVCFRDLYFLKMNRAIYLAYH